MMIGIKKDCIFATLKVMRHESADCKGRLFLCPERLIIKGMTYVVSVTTTGEHYHQTIRIMPFFLIKCNAI